MYKIADVDKGHLGIAADRGCDDQSVALKTGWRPLVKVLPKQAELDIRCPCKFELADLFLDRRLVAEERDIEPPFTCSGQIWQCACRGTNESFYLKPQKLRYLNTT